MVDKFRNTICPPPPQLSLHRRAALSRNSNGNGPYIAECTKKQFIFLALLRGRIPKNIGRCLWLFPARASNRAVKYGESIFGFVGFSISYN
jgi:hypothetical protein